MSSELEIQTRVLLLSITEILATACEGISKDLGAEGTKFNSTGAATHLSLAAASSCWRRVSSMRASRPAILDLRFAWFLEFRMVPRRRQNLLARIRVS